MELTTQEKREALRKMLKGPGIHIGPSCNDPLAARLVEWLGFPLVHLSGSSLHRSFGFAEGFRSSEKQRGADRDGVLAER